MRRALFAFGATLVAACVFAQAPPTAEPALDEILVNGVRPGPGLWRISKAGHVLWILGTIEPLEKAARWSSEEIETRIAASQAVLSAPSAEPHVGFFRSITLLPALFRARHRPDAATLEQALPHEVYIRWLRLRVKYLKRADEELRPAFAAFNLFQGAMEQEGFTFDTGVWARVETIAKRHKVPVLENDVDVKIKNPKDYLKDLDEVPRSGEIGCLESTIGALETDLPRLHARAVAWTVGDVSKLNEAAPPGPEACLESLLSVPRFRAEFNSVQGLLHAQWLTAARAALAHNESTFAVLPLRSIKEDDGVIATLRGEGYEVEAPR